MIKLYTICSFVKKSHNPIDFQLTSKDQNKSDETIDKGDDSGLNRIYKSLIYSRFFTCKNAFSKCHSICLNIHLYYILLGKSNLGLLEIYQSRNASKIELHFSCIYQLGDAVDSFLNENNCWRL